MHNINFVGVYTNNNTNMTYTTSAGASEHENIAHLRLRGASKLGGDIITVNIEVTNKITGAIFLGNDSLRNIGLICTP